jgi:hypothetical protein
MYSIALLSGGAGYHNNLELPVGGDKEVHTSVHVALRHDVEAHIFVSSGSGSVQSTSPQSKT